MCKCFNRESIVNVCVILCKYNHSENGTLVKMTLSDRMEFSLSGRPFYTRNRRLAQRTIKITNLKCIDFPPMLAVRCRTVCSVYIAVFECAVIRFLSVSFRFLMNAKNKRKQNCC